MALWSLPAGTTVAVDGRFTTAYPDEVLEEAWRFMRGDPGWSDILARHPTDVVVASRAQPSAQLLRNNPEWAYIYSDPVSTVFVRREGSQAAALARLQAGQFSYDPSPLDTVFPALERKSATRAPVTLSSATLTNAWTDP